MMYLKLALVILLVLATWISLVTRDFYYSLYQAKVDGKEGLNRDEVLLILWGRIIPVELLWKIKLDPHPNITDSELSKFQKILDLFFYIQYIVFTILLLTLFLYKYA